MGMLVSLGVWQVVYLRAYFRYVKFWVQVETLKQWDPYILVEVITNVSSLGRSILSRVPYLLRLRWILAIDINVITLF